MKQLEVQIMGQSYLLGCPEGGDSRLLDAVERVDTAMCRIRDGGKVRARDRIAVLAALNLAFDLSDRNHDTRNGAPGQGASGHADAMRTGSAPLAALDRYGDSNAASDPALASLVERLDLALSDDGRLI